MKLSQYTSSNPDATSKTTFHTNPDTSSHTIHDAASLATFHAATNTKVDETEPCTFLDLSAELQNRIYEITLVSDDAIEIDDESKQPGLLQTNRQVRQEATKVWYFQNSFLVSIDECDARLAALFQEHLMEKFPKNDAWINIEVEQVVDPNEPNWWNLVESS